MEDERTTNDAGQPRSSHKTQTPFDVVPKKETFLAMEEATDNDHGIRETASFA